MTTNSNQKILTVCPCAKINLGLNVVERRPDGYHNLETVFFPVAVTDRLEVTRMAGDELGCQLTVGGLPIEGDPRKNLVVRAYDLLRQDFAQQMAPVQVLLEKHIPTQAGMGGGSSDCAYTIRALNELFRLGLSREQMIGYAARLGADCPFFILDCPAYAEGIGERLMPISLSLNEYQLAVVKPDIPVSTKEAFSLIRPQRPQKNCLDIVRQPVEIWRDELKNDFETSVFALHPEIAAVKQRLYDMGAVYASMSGSGSAVFGFFRKEHPLTESILCEEPAFINMYARLLTL